METIILQYKKNDINEGEKTQTSHNIKKGRLLSDTPSARRWKQNINLGASIAMAHTTGRLVIDSDDGRTPSPEERELGKMCTST